MENATYTPGDTANGHILTAEGTWVPMGTPPQKPGMSKGMKIGLGIAGVLAAAIAIGAVANVSGGSDAPADQTTVSAPQNKEAPAPAPAPEPSVDEIVDGYIAVSSDLSDVFFFMSEATTEAEMEAGAEEMVTLTEEGLALPDFPDEPTLNAEWDAAMTDYHNAGEAILDGDIEAAMVYMESGIENMEDATAAIPTA